MPVMKEPSGMPAAVTCMPGARPAVLATVTFALALVGVIEGEATVVEVPSAEARPVLTTPPAMMRRPLQEELAALRKSVPWSCLRREANWPAVAARSKALSNCRVLPPTTSIWRTFAVLARRRACVPVRVRSEVVRKAAVPVEGLSTTRLAALPSWPSAETERTP